MLSDHRPVFSQFTLAFNQNGDFNQKEENDPKKNQELRH